ncbi:MAG: HD domain-containing protein [Deltaproteobacteria bacterium]|nr:HD domain-containing protein [Deltaproteobacteria bacterium]
MSSDPQKVLFVDDEPALCRAFARTFRHDPVSVHTVTRPADALRLLEQTEFAVIASDYRMPGMDGVALLSASRELAPSSRRLLVSGCCDFEIARQAINLAGIDQIVIKPWENDELRTVVFTAKRHYAMAREQERLAAELHARTVQLEQANLDLDAKLRARTTNLLDSLIAALDLRDTETLWHSRRVASYSRRLAEAVGLGSTEVDDIERGALLHDIGKIGVRDAILRKPGQLTPAEWEEMKQHSVLGYRLLHGIDYLAAARTIVLQHQERWDGQGYPAGLRGEEIIIGARIFNVADTLDAVTSDRPYRQARGFDVARAEILRCSDTQFDPRIVAAYASVPDAEWAALGAPLLSVERSGERACAPPLAG